MAKKDQKIEDSKEFENVQEALSASEAFIEKNQKTLIITLVAILVIATIALLVQNLILIPNEQEADSKMIQGQQYFASGLYDIAINGDSIDFDGFVAIADDYSFTRSGNLANVYAGLSYYKTGDYENAVKYLDKADLNDEVLKYTTLGTIGDAYVQLGENDKAVKYFVKASKADNELVAPVYAVKAGLVYEALGNKAEALKIYENVKANATAKQRGIPEVDNIDKYIAGVR